MGAEKVSELRDGPAPPSFLINPNVDLPSKLPVEIDQFGIDEAGNAGAALPDELGKGAEVRRFRKVGHWCQATS